MWLFFAVLAPLTFAFVHVLDEHCVEDIFEHPWMGMVTSSLASLVAFIPLPFLLQYFDWQWPIVQIVVLCLVVGVIVQISSGIQFQCLAYSEAGIVAAYWNLIPVVVLLLSYILFREVLSPIRYAAIAVLLLSSVCFCLLDSNLHARWKTLSLMLIAVCLESALYIGEEYIFRQTSFLVGFYLITTGVVLGGTVPLLAKRVRTVFARNKDPLLKAAKLFIGIEIINLVALASSQRAVDLGMPSMVSAIEATIPGFTFLISLLCLALYPQWGNTHTKHLWPKLGLVGVMCLGVFMLS